MARGFRRTGRLYVATIDEMERGVVAGLMDQTRDLIAPPERESTGDPFEDLVAGLGVSLAAQDQTPDTPDEPAHRDPALDRLLPTGDRLELTREEAEATVIALTDTRLLLGERLGLRTDEDATHLEERLAGLDDDDPTVYAVSFYDFLTWLQESLTNALMRSAGRGRSR